MSEAGPATYRFGEFTLDVEQGCLLSGRTAVALRPRSYDLLRYFVEHPGRLIGRGELMSALWPRVVVTDESLTHCVTDVRQALKDSERRLVRTVPRRGYLFAAMVQRPQTVSATPVPSPPRQATRGEPPLKATPLIGREADERQTLQLLAEHRIVSLVGAGGVGKSALARSVFDCLRETCADGVCWVDLAALPADAGQGVAVAVAGAAGITIGSADPLSALQGALKPLQLLLVLDNAEHLADAVRTLVRTLMPCAPQLRVLVTSQVPLGVPIEQVLRLLPLAMPPRRCRS